MELWFTELQKADLGISCKVLQTLHREVSPYQEIAVLDTTPYGRMLVLDGMVMLTIKDEFVYHEMITHVPLSTHPAPKDVLVIGGGDGGTVRETLRHKEVKRITLVEIDRRVSDVSREFLPELGCSLDDPRVHCSFEDGVAYVKGKESCYDVILVDSTEPIGQAARLFSGEFFQAVYRALRPDGLFVAQSESPFLNDDLIPAVYREVKQSFSITKLYLASIPTYPSGLWSFTLGSKVYDPEQEVRRLPFVESLRYYNPEVHRGSFKLPNFVQEMLYQEG